MATNLRDENKRWQRAGQTVGAQAAARVASVLCLLVQTPLLLKHFGTDSFGWLMAVTSFVGLSQFADIGSAIALQQQLSVAWASGEVDRLSQVYAGGRRLLLRLAAAWFLPGLALALLLGPRVLPSPAGGRDYMSWVALVVSVVVGLRFSAAPRLAAAIQSGWLAAGWTAVSNVIALGCVAAGVYLKAPPVYFVMAIALGQVFPGILTEIQMRIRFDWARTQPRASEVTEASRAIWSEGVHYALPNLAGAALQMSTPAIFAHWGGYAASAAYSILLRLYGLAVQGQAMVLAPLWPAYAEAEARGNRQWVRHTFKVSLALSGMFIGVICFCAGALPWITTFWLGANAPEIAKPLGWLVALWCCATVASQALSYLLLGLGRLTKIAKGIGFAHIGTMALMAAGGHFIGANGVAAGLASGASLLGLPQFVACTNRSLKGEKGPSDE